MKYTRRVDVLFLTTILKWQSAVIAYISIYCCCFFIITVRVEMSKIRDSYH